MTAAAGELVGAAATRGGRRGEVVGPRFEDQCRYALEELKHLAPWVELPMPAEPMWRSGDADQVRCAGELRELLHRLDQVPSLVEVDMKLFRRT